MPDDDSQTADPPTTTSRQDPKSVVNDPRDDLRKQVAMHRRGVQRFLARRLTPRPGADTLRH